MEVEPAESETKRNDTNNLLERNFNERRAVLLRK